MDLLVMLLCRHAQIHAHCLQIMMIIELNNTPFFKKFLNKMLRFNVAIFMIDVLVYISCIEDIVYYSILFDFTSTAVIFQEDNVLGLWHRTPTT